MKKYLSSKKNRDTLIWVNVAMSVILALSSVLIDQAFGKSSYVYIYIMQGICFVNLMIAFSLIICNVWVRSKSKLKRRDKYLGRDK